MTDRLLTPAQAAEQLGIGVKLLREHIRGGLISYIDVGRGLRRKAARRHPTTSPPSSRGRGGPNHVRLQAPGEEPVLLLRVPAQRAAVFWLDWLPRKPEARQVERREAGGSRSRPPGTEPKSFRSADRRPRRRAALDRARAALPRQRTEDLQGRPRLARARARAEPAPHRDLERPRRRARRAPAGGGVSNATANRTVTEPLRRLLLRAESAWEQQVPKINWTVHLLPEPAERVRELSADEEARILPELAPDYRDAVLFSLISGCRLGECVNLRWPDVDWGNREITIRGKGTGGAPKVEKIPLTGAMRELLWPRRAHHREWVFTYPTREGRVHLTYEGMKSAWRRAIEARRRRGLPLPRQPPHRRDTATALGGQSQGRTEAAQALRDRDHVEVRARHHGGCATGNGTRRRRLLTRRRIKSQPCIG